MKLIYFIAALISFTLFRFHPFCFQFGIPEENHTSFAAGQALGILLLIKCISPFTLSGKYQNIINKIYRIAFWCAISNLMDELFFNPLHLGYNEIAFVLIIFIHEFIFIQYYGSSNTTN